KQTSRRRPNPLGASPGSRSQAAGARPAGFFSSLLGPVGEQGLCLSEGFVEIAGEIFAAVPIEAAGAVEREEGLSAKSGDQEDDSLAREAFMQVVEHVDPGRVD